jgi:hypothetical protein
MLSFFLNGVLDFYMYIRYYVLPFFHFTGKTGLTKEIIMKKYIFADQSEGMAYLCNNMSYIALTKTDIIPIDEPSPITEVIIKTKQGVIHNARLVKIMQSLGGCKGDFHHQAYTLNDIRRLFGDIEGDIVKLICTNENYEEYIFY